MDRNQPSQLSCPICGDPSAVWMPPSGHYTDVDCPSCGKIRLTGTAAKELESKKSLPRFDLQTLSKELKAQPRSPQNPRLVVDSYLLDALCGTARA